MHFHRIIGALAILLLCRLLPAMTPDEQFFEAKVRPLLVNRCFECHGAKKQQGEVRLDSRGAMMHAGATGPVIVPGEPEKSRILQVIHYDEYDTQMPPEGKMPSEEIAVITEWVRRGAPWPGDEAKPPATTTGYDFEALRESHWAFQPLESVAPPTLETDGRPANPIDAFVTARLKSAGLSLSPPADQRTLLRRLSFDLTGLPPGPADVTTFEADASPEAYRQAIERLLASPLYGQRYGRHWLDIARYADTKGYVVAGEEFRYPFAYTYRDYVIDAFNADKPYDRFVLEQLAADRLELGEHAPELAALGFLTVGRQALNRRDEIIDDRIDVVTRGLQGLTVTCARCHDHKFDPIPTADYYSLYGVFDSCEDVDFGQCPQIGEAEPSPEFERYQTQLAKLQGEFDSYSESLRVAIENEARARASAYFVKFRDAKATPPGGELRPGVQRSLQTLLTRAKADDQLFGPWSRLSKLSSNGYERHATELLRDWDDDPAFANPVNQLVLQRLKRQPLKSVADLDRVFAELIAETAGLSQSAAPELRALDEALRAAGAPFAVSLDNLDTFRNRAERNELRNRQKKIDTFRAASDVAPPRAMVIAEKPQPVEPRIFTRGDANRRGEKVPRQFLRIVAGPDREPFGEGSGRLEMAQQIVDPANPLTARVMVNRIWQWHFGAGLVDSPSDFGVRTAPPSHPELLDWLANEFMRSGWSVKHMHRLILTSETYRQSSQASEERIARGESVDPLNRLLWRQNRRRLEFEPLRDAMLAAADRLDPSLSGRPIDQFDPSVRRRTVYGFVNRNDLPGTLRTFDFANPDATTGERNATTVPQQALFCMNHPFVIEQAKGLATQGSAAASSDLQEQVAQLYAIALQRSPSAEELAAAVAFLKSPSHAPLSTIEQLAQVLMLTNEFTFID